MLRGRQNVEGFTLIEIIMVTGLIAIIAGISVPVVTSSLSINKAQSAAEELDNYAFRVQQDAYTGKEDYDYGMSLPEGSNTYTLFTGASLATSIDSTEITMPGGVTIDNVTVNGGGNEVVFTSGDLRPSGSVSLEVTSDTGSFTVEINSEGLIQYYRT